MADTPFTPGDDYEPVSPRIGPIEPPVMRTEYQLPWNRKSNQTACGQTIQVQNGDLNWRVVIEGIMSLPQLNQLRSLRSEEEIEVVTEEFGSMMVSFDQFNITRADDEDVAEINDVVGPLLSFQLQTKENNEENSGTVRFPDDG